MTEQAEYANVDQSEIKKFERLASRWWDREGEFKPLHDINPIRANYIDLHSPVAERHVLDVGCGGGILTEALAQRGAIASGIDMGDAPLEVAKLHALESNLDIQYQQTTAEAHASAHPNSFNVVACMEMLEHVPDPASVVAACAELASPGASIYFSTINRTPKAYAFAIVGAEYLLKLLPKGTHEYKKFILPSELCEWVRRAGLLVQDISGITYSPITKKYQLSDDDVSVNYMLHAIKPTAE